MNEGSVKNKLSSLVKRTKDKISGRYDLRNVSPNTKQYRDIAFKYVEKDASNLQYVPTSVDWYEELARFALKRSKSNLQYITNKKIILEEIKSPYFNLRNVSKDVIDKEIAMEAVRKKGRALEYVPKDVIDKEIAMEAVKEEPYALEYVQANIEGYKEIATETVKQCPSALGYIPVDAKGYKEFAITAIKQYVSNYSGGHRYSHSHIPSFRDEYREYGDKYEKYERDYYIYRYKLSHYDDERYKEKPQKLDKEEYKKTVLKPKDNKKAFPLRYVPTNVEGYKEIAIEAIKLDYYALSYIPKEVIDKEIAMVAVKKNGDALEYVPKDIIDKEIVLEAIKKNIYPLLHYVPKDIKNYKEIVLEVAKKTPNVLKCIQKDTMGKEIAMEAVKQDAKALEYIPKEIIDKEIAMVAVKENGWALKYVPKDVIDKELAMEAIKDSVYAIAYVPEDVEGYKEIMMKILKEHPNITQELKDFVNKVKKEQEITDNVRVAVDWWANAIQTSEFKTGDTKADVLVSELPNHKNERSEEEMKKFKDSLTKNVKAELNRNGRCKLFVGYEPCEILAEAGSKIGLDNATAYPCKTFMDISEYAIEVLTYPDAYGSNEVIWSKEKKQQEEQGVEVHRTR